MDLKELKSATRSNLEKLSNRVKRLTPGTIYGSLCASTLWPVISAAGLGDFGAVGALCGVLGSMGGGLVAGRIQEWRDRSEAELATELGEKAKDDPEWREALDKLLEEFESPRIVQGALTEPDKEWFARTLKDELSELGNLERYQAMLVGDGAIAQGERPKGAGKRGVAAETIQDSIVITGDQNRAVRAETYIEEQKVHREVHIHGRPTPDPADLRTSYLNRVFKQTGTVSLAGVDPKAASEAEARLNLGAVYTALLTLTPEMRESLSRGMTPERDARRLSAVEQLNRHDRLVLLGDPGSGKSTFVNFVALCLAGEALKRPKVNLALLTAPLPKEKDDDEDHKESQPWKHGALLPVRVVLRDFAARGLPAAGEQASAEHLWRFIVSELKSASIADYAPFLREQLLNKGGLVLLDGLDEVPEADRRRSQIRDAVEDFAATFVRCRILVTSRTYAYQEQDWRLANFVATVLAPFSAGQIRRFVDRWYAHIAEVRHLHPEDAQGRAELLKRAIFGGERLRALAERPLLMTLMASLHAWRGGSLPEKREELYSDAVELLLDWWESQRVVRDAHGNVVVIQPSLAEWLKVDREKVRELLNELAYKAHAAQPDFVGTADVPQGELVAGFMDLSQNPEINPARLVEYLSQRAGLLVPRGVGVYTFPHRTFQEYLAACHLTDYEYPDLLAELARNDPGRWREVALLAGAKTTRGTSSAIWSLVEALCFREPEDPASSLADTWGAHLAGQALVESANLERVTERNQRKVECVVRGLMHVLRGADLPALERAQAGRVLAKLGDPRQEVATVEKMQFCCVPAGPFWMGDGSDVHLNEALSYDYWISRFPVTNAQYQAFVESGGYGEGRYWKEAEQAGFWKTGSFKGRYDDEARSEPIELGERFNLPNHPVVGVTWYEALAFTRWLTENLREAGLLPQDWEISLPSEVEWEKAARGGLKVPTQPVILAIGGGLKSLPKVQSNPNLVPKRLYPWGDKADANRANYSDTDVGVTNAVGCFRGGAGPYGAEELSGNVWEWTRSLWGRDLTKTDFIYPYNPADGREKLDASDEVCRVLRGGAFDFGEYLVRCANRGRGGPDDRVDDLGFRVVAFPSTSGL